LSIGKEESQLDATVTVY